VALVPGHSPQEAGLKEGWMRECSWGTQRDGTLDFSSAFPLAGKFGFTFLNFSFLDYLAGIKVIQGSEAQEIRCIHTFELLDMTQVLIYNMEDKSQKTQKPLPLAYIVEKEHKMSKTYAVRCRYIAREKKYGQRSWMACDVRLGG
jgi:hypothetical protein